MHGATIKVLIYILFILHIQEESILRILSTYVFTWLLAFHSLRWNMLPTRFLPLELNFTAIPQNLTG